MSAIRAQLREIFAAALAAVDASHAVERALRTGSDEPGTPGELEPARWRSLGLLAVGKAACAMAAGAARVLQDRVVFAQITTREGHGDPRCPWPWHEAAHPVPDERSVRAAQRALAAVASAPPGLPLLVLISGGASALWTLPAAPLTLADKQRVTDLLLRCGADIGAINTVRRHLSAIKGGALARAAGQRAICTLAISDVRGDAAEAIGSGPTAPDPTSFADALAVVHRLGIAAELPVAARARLETGARAGPENPAASAACFGVARYRVIASLPHALAAAERSARERGLRVRALGASLYGEARTLASVLARAARDARDEGIELLIAGGEPTVTVRGGGIGGRAQELALAFALQIEGESRIDALFAGTDGSDGPTSAAGAFCDGGLVDRARQAGRDARASLLDNDANPLLASTGDLLVTGPTGTNVNDLALIRIQR